MDEEIEGDCRTVGEDWPSGCDVVFSEGGALVGWACSGGSIIVIDAEEGGEGGEWKSEWWRLTGFSALDGKNQCCVFSGQACRNWGRARGWNKDRDSHDGGQQCKLIHGGEG